MKEQTVLEAEVIDEDSGAGVAVELAGRQQVGGLIRPVAEPAEILEVQEQTRALIEQALKPGRDYDTIPGTSKPTLLKPGAERINAAFGCGTRYTILEAEIDHDRHNDFVKRTWEWHPETRGKKVWSETEGQSTGLYRYVMMCELVHRESGVVIGQGVGSCSTMESKYIDRPRDLENTILKMAKKRAFVDATLTTFGLSEQFTQDMEDGTGERGKSGGGPPKSNGQNLESLDDAVGFGKHKGKTWREVLLKDRQYVAWAADNANLPESAREILRAACAASEPARDVPADPDDDLPF